MIEFEKPNIKCVETDEKKKLFKVCMRATRTWLWNDNWKFTKKNFIIITTRSCNNKYKIDGVVHEFSTVPGVVEDVPELIVNLKCVRLKMHDNEDKNISINFKGPGEVKAGDIITDSG